MSSLSVGKRRAMIRKLADRHRLYRAWRFAHSGLSELPRTRHRERSGFALGQRNSAPLRRALEWSPTQSIVTLTSFLLLSKSWKRELNKLNQQIGRASCRERDKT